jgi:hypothetical protein
MPLNLNGLRPARSPSHRTHRAPHRHLRTPASLRDISLAPRLHRTSQQAPSLPVHFKHPLASRPIIKVHRRPRNKRIRRNHIPQILLDHIRHQKINVIQRVEFPAPGSPSLASRTPMAGRTLHLNFPQPPGLNRKVIRTAVSPRLSAPEYPASGPSPETHPPPPPPAACAEAHPASVTMGTFACSPNLAFEVCEA